jgi:hypothetical protein
MNQKLNLTLAFTAGLLGSALMHYIAPPPAFAQDQTPAQTPAAKEIRAQSIALVDPSNNVIGVFTSEPLSPATSPKAAARVVLKDQRGRVLWTPESNTKLLPLSLK